MTKDKDGGAYPAFPLQSIGPEFAPGYAGMTLRDYVAAQVFASFVANPDTTLTGDAEMAFKAADAWLAAREGGDA